MKTKNIDSKQLLFKNMEKLNPDFKNNISEIVPSNQATTPQPSVVNQAQPSAPKQPSDVQSLNRATQSASSVQRASSRINTTTEFPEAFRLWFSSLGYKPDNPAISIMKVKTEIDKVMKSMGYR